jgi:putative membrane protein
MAWLWAGIYTTVLFWSAFEPVDGFTWLLEVLPALVAALVLVATRRRFPLTPLVYVLILIHCVILMVGGHYTYARVPLFDQLAELVGSSRNNYDKLGHFAQGFIPALVARELLCRLGVIRGPRWRAFFILCFCLALSALYELIEWGVAVLTGTGADAFLGTQGYVWDTQSDMAFCLLGALCALALLGRFHDRQLERRGW